MGRIISKSFSFDGWTLWEHIKGRKKMAITIVAGILGYVISDSATIAIVSGGVVEVAWALVEYYIKEKRMLS